MQKCRSAQQIPRPRAVGKLPFPGSRHAEHVRPLTTYGPAQRLQQNNRINHYRIDHLPAAAWQASPPEGKGRTIQAIVAHMHNVRVMWLTSAAKGSKIPNQLDRAKVTAPQALRGNGTEPRSSQRSLGPSHYGRRPRQRFSSGRNRLSRLSHRPWRSPSRTSYHACPPNGYPFPQKVMFGMWEWNSR